jgi:hypothetical protein
LNETTTTTTTVDAGGEQASASRDSRPKVVVANSETGFEDVGTTAAPTASPSMKAEDIASVVWTLVSGDWPSETESNDPQRVHEEATEGGFEEPTLTEGVVQTTGAAQTEATAQTGATAQTEATTQTAVMSQNIWTPTVVTNNGQVFTPLPTANIILEGQTLTPGGETATIGEGDSATKVHLDESGAPIVVIGDSTSTAPIPSTPSQVFNIGDLTATPQTAAFQFLVASSTLAIGQSVTLSGTIIALTTNAAGATVLVAGASTTTLAPSAQTMPIPDALQVATTVVDGTTQYLIDSQTLAPGRPVTVDGKPISISMMGSVTVLMVGDKTTTLGSPRSTDFSITGGFAVATPGSEPGSGSGSSVGGGGGAATSSSKVGGSGRIREWSVKGHLFAFGMVLLGLG